MLFDTVWATGGRLQRPRPESSSACGPLGGAFTSAWPQLRERLEAGAQGLAELIDHERGVFVLDNPGAYVIPMYFETYEEATERVAKLRADDYSFTCSEPSDGPTPSFSCDTELWSRQGCVVTRAPEFSVARWYDLAVEYELMENEEVSADREKARQADASIEYGVYTTDTSLGLYFAKTSCAWRVVAIDVITPCSA